MVKIFIYTLLVIVSAVGLIFYLDLPGDSGYLLIAWRNYTFETSIFALVTFLTVDFIALRILMLLLSALNPLRLFRPGGVFSRGANESRSRSRAS